DGSVDTEFNPAAGADGPVRAIAIQPDGSILIGGSFVSVNDNLRNYLARLNSDGSIDPLFLASLPGGDSAVYALALQPDGKIIVAGDFLTFNGVNRSRI